MKASPLNSERDLVVRGSFTQGSPLPLTSHSKKPPIPKANQTQRHPLELNYKKGLDSSDLKSSIENAEKYLTNG